MTSNIGELFVSAGAIDSEQLKRVEDYQKKAGGFLATHLVRLGAVSEENFTKTLNKELGCQVVELESYAFDPSLVDYVPNKLAKKHGIVPLVKEGDTLVLAMLDPTNSDALEEVNFITALDVKPVVASPKSITKAQRELYSGKLEIPNSATEVQETSKPSSAPTMVWPDRNKMYYSHSGVIGVMGPIYMAVGGYLSVLVLSYTYVYATTFIPFVYLNFLLNLCFGGGIGAAVGLCARYGKTRNLAVIGLFGFVLGCYATYFSWIIWIDMLTDHTGVSTVSGIMGVIDELSVTGVWEIMGLVPKGGALKLMWAIEALIIVGAAAGVGVGFLSSTPYCERCQLWLTKPVVKEKFIWIFEAGNLTRNLEQGNFTPLTTLQTTDFGNTDYSKVELLQCKKCRVLSLVTVKNIHIEENEHGVKTTKADPVIENITINRDVYSWLLSNIK
ncbi:hypothetical protein OAO01_08220 [Oligoflexia bacterium]|nr:hypothetical protein [Oligoflexia bacterium]